MVAVVDLPTVPVTPTTTAGQAFRNNSVSEVICCTAAPRDFDERILRSYRGIDDDHFSRLKIALMMPAKGESCDRHIGKLGDRFSQRLLIR